MNHLAFAVHRFKHRFNDIKCVKEYLEEKGFKLNSDGGILKGFFYLFPACSNISTYTLAPVKLWYFAIFFLLIVLLWPIPPFFFMCTVSKKYYLFYSPSVSQDGLLIQISSISERLAVEFADGVTEIIPASYIEFTQRLALPQFKDMPSDEVTERNRRFILIAFLR